MSTPSVRYEDIRVGHRFAPDTFVVRGADIDSYRRIVGAGHPEPGAEPGPGKAVASPTLATVHLFRSYYAAFPPSPGRLHAAVQFSFFRPWIEDTNITVNGVVTDKYVKRGKKYVRFELTFTDEAGQELTKAVVDEITLE